MKKFLNGTEQTVEATASEATNRRCLAVTYLPKQDIGMFNRTNTLDSLGNNRIPNTLTYPSKKPTLKYYALQCDGEEEEV